MSIQIFCFLMIQSWKMIFFLGICYLFSVVRYFEMQFFIVISYGTLFFCAICYNFSFIYFESSPFFLDMSSLRFYQFGLYLWQTTPVFLPGESHGWRSLVGYSPRGRKESDTTEWLHFHFHFHLTRSKLWLPVVYIYI